VISSARTGAGNCTGIFISIWILWEKQAEREPRKPVMFQESLQVILRRLMIMVQTVDVVAIFDKMIREPKPVRFKIYDSGHWKSVNVDRIYNTEWMRLDGKVQIVYNCASRSCNGQMINYKLKFIHQDIRWEMEMDGPIVTPGRRIS
jgi:hypothetical protein